MCNPILAPRCRTGTGKSLTFVGHKSGGKHGGLTQAVVHAVPSVTRSGSLRYTCSTVTAPTANEKPAVPSQPRYTLDENLWSVTGEMNAYDVIGDSGRLVMVLPDLHPPIVTEFEVEPHFVCVKACSLDDSSGLKPEFHLSLRQV